MGLFRKLTSAATLGAVDFKSDKERIASYTKGTRKQAKAQTELLRAAARPMTNVEKLAQIRAGDAARAAELAAAAEAQKPVD